MSSATSGTRLAAVANQRRRERREKQQAAKLKAPCVQIRDVDKIVSQESTSHLGEQKSISCAPTTSLTFDDSTLSSQSVVTKDTFNFALPTVAAGRKHENKNPSKPACPPEKNKLTTPRQRHARFQRNNGISVTSTSTASSSYRNILRTRVNEKKDRNTCATTKGNKSSTLPETHASDSVIANHGVAAEACREKPEHHAVQRENSLTFDDSTLSSGSYCHSITTKFNPSPPMVIMPTSNVIRLNPTKRGSSKPGHLAGNNNLATPRHTNVRPQRSNGISVNSAPMTSSTNRIELRLRGPKSKNTKGSACTGTEDSHSSTPSIAYASDSVSVGSGGLAAEACREKVKYLTAERDNLRSDATTLRQKLKSAVEMGKTQKKEANKVISKLKEVAKTREVTFSIRVNELTRKCCAQDKAMYKMKVDYEVGFGSFAPSILLD